MKIGFFGTPQIAREVLEALCEKYDVLFAVSSIDKAQGRSKKLRKTPVRSCAEERCFDLFQPETLKDAELVETLRAYQADIFVVFAYGHIIPRAVFELPPLGTINLHPSLLPKYRGAAPVQWALINGETESGVTVQLIDEKLDSGDIVRQERLDIPTDWTSCELYNAAIPLGIRLLDEAIAGLADGSISPEKQNHDEASHCKKLTRELAKLDWSKSAKELHNLIRGLNPKPIAWTMFRDNELKIWRSSLFEEHSDGIPALQEGELFKLGKKRLLVGTGDGLLEIKSLQPATKKEMDVAGFLNGARLEAGESFSS